MKTRHTFALLLFVMCVANIGCVMFDGADDFPQPCYGPDCVGGGLAQYGNAQYGHSGGYIGEPVFTPTAPVIPGGAPIPPGVTEVQLAPDEPSSSAKSTTNDEQSSNTEESNGLKSVDIPSPPPAPPVPKP